MNTPYEYYENKLGVKLGFLVYDKHVSEGSIKVISYNAINKRIKSSTCPEQQLRRASLNYEALILFSSLCKEWREAITLKFGNPKEEVKRSWFSEHYVADRSAFDFYTAYRYGDDNRKLDLKLIETYTYNASVLNAVITMKNNRKAYIKALGVTKVDIWQSISNDVNAFREVEHNLPTTPRGLRIRVTEYLKHGYVSLVSGRLQNKNAAKIKDNKQTALIDELLAKHTNFDNAQVANLYNTVAEMMEWPTITPQTVANRKEERNLVVFAGRKGSNALSNQILMQNKRFAPTAPMLYWTMDGWDTELLYQKTTINKTGKSVTTYHNRLTMVVILDPFNKYPIGYAIGTHETPELIKSAMRNAFVHTRELFGEYYRPYQLQTDNYGGAALKSMYEACSVHYTPAKVKNAKSKVIEPWFNRFNKKYCQMFDNWSGHNLVSGSKSQPNAEMLNKLSKQFPDEQGCRQQLIMSIETERAKLREEYVKQWSGTPAQFKSALNFEDYLRFLGQTTGYTNRLQPDGLNVTIEGVTYGYDCFDINFRKLAHLDWAVMYDPNDISKVLVSNAKSQKGKLIEIEGNYEFVLERKYIQPMALAERTDGDALKLQEVKNYNKAITDFIIDERTDNAQHLEELFAENPKLNQTLAKLVLVDSNGQHKNNKSNSRLKEASKPIIEVQSERPKSEPNEINEYNKSKVDLNNYL